MKNKANKVLSKLVLAASSISLAAASISLLEIDFWVWCLIIIAPLLLALIVGPIIFFVWKKKRSKDYAANPSKSRVETFIKNRK